MDISSQKRLFQGYRLVITTSPQLILMILLNSVIISFFLSFVVLISLYLLIIDAEVTIALAHTQ